VLRINLLGAPAIDVEGKPLAVDTRKATALAAYLAVEGGAHSRDSLACLFWPDYEQERSRAALRRTLSTLRTAVGGETLVVDRDAVSLERSRLELDIDEFRRCAAEPDTASLEAAVALHRGPFMAGFSIRDSAPFDDWQSFNSSTLARELGAVLDRAADACAARGDWPRAIEHARRRLALDELHEPAHRRLMQFYAAGGERSAAFDQYRDCVRVLHRELGVAPLDTTTTLYRAIREGSIDVPVDALPTPALPEHTGHPFVGRALEWQQILDAYGSVGPDGRLVVIEGEIGIGKTRLGDELLDWARARGAIAVTTRCFEDERGLAFGSVLDLLRGALREGDAGGIDPSSAGEAARLLPELGTPPTRSLDDPGAHARFVEGVVQTLLAAAHGEQPAVVMVDDVHWADASSLEVFAYLARRLRGRPFLLVVTWRMEETPATHPARRLLTEAVRDGLGTSIRLGRFDRVQVGELVGAAGLSPELVDPLFAETRGLPFFVVEYLDSLGEDAGDWPLPAGVRDVLETRLASTSEVAGQVAAAAAVLGRPFEPELVRDVSGRSDEETVSAIEELSARGILADLDPGVHDFRHEQTRKVAYERTSLGRRRLLHRRAADALAVAGRGTTGAGVVAQHFRLAGREAEAADWFRLAGEQARGLYANAEALAYFREALAVGPPSAGALHEAIGDLLTLAGDYAAALPSYEAAAAEASDGEIAGIEHRIGLVHDRRGEWELADGSFTAALETLPETATALRARIVADQSLTAHRRGRDDQALVLAQDALALATAAGDRRARAQAHNLLGILAADGGRQAEAREHLEESLALAGPDDPGARAAALNNLALLHRADGELTRALELTEEALVLAATVGDRHREAALLNNAADLLHAAGRHDEAMERLKSAVAIFAEIGEEGAMEPEIWKLVDW
jgi:DNA-binding SARP family transcriptional activator/tetratricopeptide (TPR) repeat protein